MLILRVCRLCHCAVEGVGGKVEEIQKKGGGQGGPGERGRKGGRKRIWEKQIS